MDLALFISKVNEILEQEGMKPKVVFRNGSGLDHDHEIHDVQIDPKENKVIIRGSL